MYLDLLVMCDLMADMKTAAFEGSVVLGGEHVVSWRAVWGSTRLGSDAGQCQRGSVGRGTRARRDEQVEDYAVWNNLACSGLWILIESSCLSTFLEVVEGQCVVF